MQPTIEQQYRTSLYQSGNNSERLFLEYRAFKKSFLRDITRILDEYGLATLLEQAKTTAHKVRILNVNCAEGLYMHSLAELLEKRGYLEGAELWGIDQESSMVATATEYSHLSNPPRPYLQFYQHDYSQPLSTLPLFKLAEEPTFDLIFFTIGSAALTPAVKSLIRQFYTHNLNPGGVMYLRDFIQDEGATGWLPPHPIMTQYLRVAVGVLKSLNEGVDISRKAADWMAELGADAIAVTPEVLPYGGASEEGRDFLRDIILSARVACPEFIRLGLMAQADYEKMLQVLFAEITPQHLGHISYLTTLAKKPGYPG